MKVQELLKAGYDILKQVDDENYMLDAQLILGKVLNKDKLYIITNRAAEVQKEKSEEYIKLIELRKKRMPVKYILGECEFMGLNFFVKEGVLIPRPDTEVLVEEVIKDIRRNNFLKVCDVCCGSGAIGLSIAEYIKTINVNCYDISEAALEVTNKNMIRFNLGDRVRVIKSDLLKKAIESEEKFDVIASNPPYIKTNIIPTLMKDVKDYEPFIALCGGEDGLDFYRRIIDESVKLLNPNGILAFEIGYDQGEAVSNMLKNYGFEDVKCIKDLAGMDRVVKGTFKYK